MIQTESSFKGKNEKIQMKNIEKNQIEEEHIEIIEKKAQKIEEKTVEKPEKIHEKTIDKTDDKTEKTEEKTNENRERSEEKELWEMYQKLEKIFKEKEIDENPSTKQAKNPIFLNENPSENRIFISQNPRKIIRKIPKQQQIAYQYVDYDENNDNNIRYVMVPERQQQKQQQIVYVDSDGQILGY